MTKKIAYITDAHLGQKLVLDATDSELAGGKMHYEAEPDQHKKNLQTIFSDVAKRGISEIVFGGDIGSEASLSWFFALSTSYDFRLALVLGNHDRWPAVAKYYSAGAASSDSELYGVRDDDYARWIFVDSSANSVSDAQLSWLREQLVTDKPVLLFVHHPVLEIDTPLDRAGAALRNREQVSDILFKADRGLTVFCGHYHMEDEQTKANVTQMVTPAASYQIPKTGRTVSIDAHSFGYRLIEISREGRLTTALVEFKD
jgi:3',5'-cyclic-AMP phosphodiesterase